MSICNNGNYFFHQWCRSQGGHWPPQYLADQLTLFQPGVGRLCPPLPLAPPKFFTFRHHCSLSFSNEDAASRVQTLSYNILGKKISLLGQVIKMFLHTFLPILLYNFYVLTKKKNEHLLLHSSDSKSMYRFISCKDAQTCIKITDFTTKKY